MVIERIVLLEAQNVHSSTAIKVVALERETRDSGRQVRQNDSVFQIQRSAS